MSNVINLGERVPLSAVGRRTNVDLEWAASQRAQRCIRDGALDEARLHLAEAQGALERLFSEVRVRRPTVQMLAIMLRSQARLDEVELEIARAMLPPTQRQGEPTERAAPRARRRRGRA